ncbi:hypothetical protein LSAT2_029441 [Lamellibrachia satsuma]|nr:hypothetical protein LSAT2_029441 [Lamellibrachia satsuma]
MKSYDALFVTAMLLLAAKADCFDQCMGKVCPAGQLCASVVPNCAEPPCARVASCVTTEKLMCFGWGDPHYVTFDAAVINFYGIDEFVMAESSLQPECEELPEFQVLVEQEHRGGNTHVSYIKYITLQIGGIVEVKIDQNRLVYVDTLPFAINQPPPTGITSIQLFTIQKQSQLKLWRDITVVRIETDFGLIVEFDGVSWASVTIPFAYRNCVEGLCGNADGVKANDFKTSQGENALLLPWNRRFWKIGNSWRVLPPTAPTVPGMKASRRKLAPLTGREQSVDKVDLSCTNNIISIVDRDDFCGSLKNDTGRFAACIVKMPGMARNVYEGCKLEVCANKNDLRFAKYLAQSSVGTFVALCAGNGLLTTKTLVPSCPVDLVWSRCGRECTRTCQRPYCRSYKCIKKCYCPRRKPYQHGNRCLSYRQCKAEGLWRRVG